MGGKEQGKQLPLEKVLAQANQSERKDIKKPERKRRKLHLRSIPVSADAVHAEAVAARCGRRVVEDIEADGALELLVR